MRSYMNVSSLNHFVNNFLDLKIYICKFKELTQALTRLRLPRLASMLSRSRDKLSFLQVTLLYQVFW